MPSRRAGRLSLRRRADRDLQRARAIAAWTVCCPHRGNGRHRLAHRSRAAAALAVGALLVALVFTSWALSFGFETFVCAVRPDQQARSSSHHRGGIHHAPAAGRGFCGAVWCRCAAFLAQAAEQPLIPMLWSACAAFVPVAILAALYYRIATSRPQPPFRCHRPRPRRTLAFAVEQLTKREPRPPCRIGSDLRHRRRSAALALAFTMALSKGWLTIALALIVPGVAWICEKRPLLAPRWLRGRHGRAGGAAHRLGAAHRRRYRRARRRSSTGCCGDRRARPPPSGSPDSCCANALMMCRPA